MKVSTIAAALALAATANAHAIMQKVRINGSDKGQLTGIRAPSSNNPIENVSDSNMACGTGGTAGSVITANPGDSVGLYWGHVIGGPQGSNDPDHPIASSHKGPIQVYIAKVSNAQSASASGQKWGKIASEGLSGGRWAVDTMISGGGWWTFSLPSCLAPGDYLLRSELLALHSAYNYPGAQFYVSCVQLRVGGSGNWTPGNTISIPGSYSGSDPGIKVSIYGSSGQPDNGGRSYTAPGGSVQGCGSSNGGGGSNPTTTAAQTTLRTTTTAGGGGGGSGAPLYGQCGGIGWTGPTSCSSGRCVANGAYYSQCVP